MFTFDISEWISPGVSILHHSNLITSSETVSAYFHNIPHLIPVKSRIKTKPNDKKTPLSWIHTLEPNLRKWTQFPDLY